MASSINSVGASTSKGLSGLVSGMDTEAMIEKLLSGTQTKIDKQQGQKQQLLWKQELYRDVMSSAKNLKDTYFDFTNPKTNISSNSFYQSMSSTVDSDLLSVVATTSAQAGKFTVNSIKQVATNAKFKSANEVTSEIKFNIKNIDQSTYDSLIKGGKSPVIKLNVDGIEREISLNTGDTFNAEKLKANIEKGLEGTGVTLKDNGSSSYELVAGNRNVVVYGDDQKHLDVIGVKSGTSNQIQFNVQLEDIKFKTELQGDQYEFKINDVSFTFKKEDTIGTVIDKINSSDAGVEIKYSSVEDKFVISSKETGAGHKINIVQGTGNLMTAMFGTDVNKTDVNKTEGQNAIFTVVTDDGTIVDMEKNTNNFTIDGLSITLKKATTDADKPIEITTTRNTEQILDGIVKFADDYNKVIEKLNNMVKEDPSYKNHAPLTDKQKGDMSESEIKLWEKKSKEGLLRGDNIVNDLISEMRSVLYTKPSDAKFALYDIGVTTSKDYKDNGKLIIKEDELRNAIENNSSELQKLFVSDDGIAKQFSNVLDRYVKSSVTKPGRLVERAGIKSGYSENKNSISKEVEDIEKGLKNLEYRYEIERNRYWKQFNSMEQLIQQMNSQSSWLSKQFS